MQQSETNISVENSGALIEDSSIVADQVAGRDIYNYYSEDPSFASVSLEYYGSDEYLSPNITDAVLKKLTDQRILLIHGGQAFDKGGFIRHLAFKVQEQTQYKTQEIELNEENESLYHQISKNSSKSIYLLDRLHPQHVDYDLQRLQILAETRSIYIIITTDLSLDIWQLDQPEQKQFCYQIPQKKLYDDFELTNYLRSRLLQRYTFSNEELKNELLERSIIFKVPLKEVAAKLNSPENLNLFVLRLVNEDFSSDRSVMEIVHSLLESKEGIVRKWFMSLSNREKLIALGAALLEGAYDDQFFSIMSQIIEGMWKYNDESLQALDYRDLDFLSDYFRFESLGDGRYVLQSKFPAQKVEIIRSCWNIYRRHLLSILPVFLDTAKKTLDTESSDWGNFGTRQRRANLRIVIGQTISEIGLVSTFSVENSFIELAAHPDDRIKRIVAKSLARWREFGEDEKLFDFLQSWLEDERPRKIISEYLSKQTGNQRSELYKERALTYLKASAIQALSYAANYDSPNKLNGRIVAVLLNLVDESQPALITNTLKSAIPKLVHHHVLQLKDVLLEDFMKYDGMVEPIASGLAKAYKDYPKDLKATLDRWFEECQDNNSQLNRRKKFTHRDKVLVTILEFYSKVEFDSAIQVISLDEVYEKLRKLCMTEQRRLVRDAIFKTASQLIKWDLNRWEKEIPNLSKDLDFNDAKHLVNALISVFLQERKGLTGNLYFFHWNEELYPAWLDLYDRPKTKLEKRLMGWIESDQIILKQLATLTFLGIAEVFELSELESIIEIKERLRERKYEQSIQPQTTQQTVVHQPIDYSLSWFTRIRIFFLLLFESKANKQTLKSILITLYKYKRYRREYKQHLILVFRKWASTDYTLLRKLTRWLRRFI